MDVEFHPRGIFLPQIDLWLDCTEPCGDNWISHGHSDHANGFHGRVFGTESTLAVYRTRLQEEPEKQPQCCAIAFGEPWQHNGARLTAFPAAHIVGAAQLLVEYDGERLLYTGDIKLKSPICGSETAIVPCDRLIIESTFGLPVYHFLTADGARERIAEFARECLKEGITPVFIGYPLGRGQEIANVLCEAAVPTAVHGAIARFIPLYEAEGYEFRNWMPYDPKTLAGSALVTVPGHPKYLEASERNFRMAYVSGWAALENARARSGAEELIPYSDHADFEELLAIVEQTGAREVDVVHGYTEMFARILADRGIRARAPREAAARLAGDEAVEG